MSAFDGLLRETFVVCAILALPPLALATIVGTIVAIAQAATQVQDQTLSLLPKLVCVAVVVALFGAFGMRLCASLFVSALEGIPQLVGG